jgi:hypothetical protein
MPFVTWCVVFHFTHAPVTFAAAVYSTSPRFNAVECCAADPDCATFKEPYLLTQMLGETGCRIVVDLPANFTLQRVDCAAIVPEG